MIAEISKMAAAHLSLTFLLALTSYPLALSAPTEDLVTSLPGLNYTINFKQYSGYLDGGQGRKLHYWWVDSQNNPSSDPVVLWLNGGPGCSSIFGLLGENGPFKIAADDLTVLDNPYSWNKIANMVYLESPGEVGYSYNTQDIPLEDDDSTSLQNFEALKDLFTNKFPEFAQNDFYITGESYGGIYVPTLVVRILNETNNLNFKGFAIGNAYLYPHLLDLTDLFFISYHGLTGIKQWNSFVTSCCNGVASFDSCNLETGDECQDAQDAVYSTIGNLDYYNIYNDGSDSSAASLKMLKHELTHMKKSIPKETKARILAHLETKTSKVKDTLDFWMNRADVRTSLHIPESLGSWLQCGGPSYQEVYSTMKPQMQFALSKVRSVIYNGDVDMVCNFLGDQKFVEDLDRELVTAYHPWYVNNQVAGYAKSWNNITFVTVKGSGHMVPQDKPGPAFEMFSKFIKNEDF